MKKVIKFIKCIIGDFEKPIQRPLTNKEFRYYDSFFRIHAGLPLRKCKCICHKCGYRR